MINSLDNHDNVRPCAAAVAYDKRSSPCNKNVPNRLPGPPPPSHGEIVYPRKDNDCIEILLQKRRLKIYVRPKSLTNICVRPNFRTYNLNVYCDEQMSRKILIQKGKL